MNRSKLKTYAPQARRDFIQAVTDRAAFYGLTKKKIEPVKVEGDVAVIRGTAFPKLVADQRGKLEERIKHEGFEQVMEAIAYTWFNRFVAIRYMELHGYSDHGYRVLSHPDGKLTPEILEHAEHVTMSGLNKQKVVELKLDGTKDEELYCLLLIAQCNALNLAMPFLFERVNGESELLLPDNLLHSGSLLRKLVAEIDEADWQEVEIIGWLYQFYISEKKDEVIGKVVKSEDIPAATQLFTPNWIVKYLVQNSIGRQWLATYPDSKLKEQMEYYIEPAEQTPEVQAQLAAITPDSLNPEEMTLLDPACGSGHILVEAYDLFKTIYQERGYRAKDIPRLILHKNLFGLEIDERAAQLASFALIMKARADDRHVLDGGVWMNVRCIRSSDGLDADAVFEALTGEEPEPLPPGVEFDFMEEARTPLLAQARRSRSTVTPDVGFTVDDIRVLLSLFKGDDAKTFGSLIRIPDGLVKKLLKITDRADRLVHGDDLNRQQLGERFQPIAAQAATLATQYDAVVANPPYMGPKAQNPNLKKFAKRHYIDTKSDLFAMFMHRGFEFAKAMTGHHAMVTMQSWMFLSSLQTFRRSLLRDHTLVALAHLDTSVMGIAFGTVASIWAQHFLRDFQTRFCHVRVADLSARSSPSEFPPMNGRNRAISASEFAKIEGSPIAYWIDKAALKAFDEGIPLHSLARPRAGMITGDNERFVRCWHEVSSSRFGTAMRSREEARTSGMKWFPYQKGGAFRRWYGNYEYVVDWENDGQRLRTTTDSSGKVPAHAFNDDYIFKANANWSAITSGVFSVRITQYGCLFDAGGSAAFPETSQLNVIAGFLNTGVARYLLEALNPTVNVQAWNIGNLPILKDILCKHETIDGIVEKCRLLSKADWNSQETSWCFRESPLLPRARGCDLLRELKLTGFGVDRDGRKENAAFLVDKCGV